MELAGKLTSEEIEPFGRLIGLAMDMVAVRDAMEVLPIDHPTFTINYPNGTKEYVQRGILFSISDENKTDIQVGVKKQQEVFDITLCLIGFLTGAGLMDGFEKYATDMMED
ncbi:MAG: hypothetical protein KBT03_12055 [Bacteroidales bacterium]|nr:hypothetical protein [Candidatus Scybalousia scybalohippi]